MLYRTGSEMEWEGRMLDTLVAEDATAVTAATADGWKAVADLAELDKPPERAKLPEGKKQGAAAVMDKPAA